MEGCLTSGMIHNTLAARARRAWLNGGGDCVRPFLPRYLRDCSSYRIYLTSLPFLSSSFYSISSLLLQTYTYIPLRFGITTQSALSTSTGLRAGDIRYKYTLSFNTQTNRQDAIQ